MLSVILFFIYLYGLGYSVTRFLGGFSKDIIPRLGIGLATLPVLGVFLHTIRLPIDWRIFLLGAVAMPVYDLIKRRPRVHWDIPLALRLDPNRTALILAVLFCCSLVMYCWGPFTYPWLEDEDSWSHAAAARYIAVERNIAVLPGTFQYILPYPPGYGIIMGVLHQTEPSIYWTLKFFNGLFVCLGILFFYFLAREFSGSEKRALWATFFLTAVPCYLSHFIWAHSLIMTLFFPGLYAILKCRSDKRFFVPAVLGAAGIFLIQPEQSLKFVILVVLLAAADLITRRKEWKTLLGIMAVAGIVSLLWWGPVLCAIQDGSLKMNTRTGTIDLASTAKAAGFLGRLFAPAAGTATRAYALHDYFLIPEYNMINNPTGIGVVISLLALLGIGYLISDLREAKRKDKLFGLTVLFWFAFAFLGLNSKTFHLPVGMVAFRFWMLLAVPVSFLAAETAWRVTTAAPSASLKNLRVMIIIVTVLISSGYDKFKVNTGAWPWGVFWHSFDELDGYIWMRTHLAPGTKVFAFVENWLVIGHDMHADYWSRAYRENFADAVNLGTEDLHRRLKATGFEYVVVGQREVKRLGLEKVNGIIRAMTASGLFETIHGVKNAVRIFKVSDRTNP